MAAVELKYSLVFLDPENPSFGPGQLLLITESVGETSCPVYAVHHNATYYDPNRFNLFPVKEKNDAAIALGVLQCVCVGPEEAVLEVDFDCGTWIDEDEVEHRVYDQSNPASDNYRKHPARYRIDTDQLSQGVGTFNFPENFTDWWFEYFRDWVRKYEVISVTPPGLQYFSPEVEESFSLPDWIQGSKDDCADIIPDTICMIPIFEVEFTPCDVWDAIGDSIVGELWIRVGFFYSSDVGPGSSAYKYDIATYAVRQIGDPQVNLLEPFSATKMSVEHLNEWTSPHDTDPANAIFNWPDTLTLYPVH